MIKIYVCFLIVISNSPSFGQHWVDSIKNANKAYKKGDYADAESIYHRHYKKAKAKGGLDEELAQTEYRMRDFNRALKHYTRKYQKSNSKKDKARLKHNIGNAYFEKGDYKKAINAYKESLRINPNDEETRYNLSQALRRSNEEQKQNKPQPPKKNPPKKNQDKNQNKNKNNKDSNQNKKDKSNQNPSQSSPNQDPGRLPKREVEKKLDELARKEGETRRKMSGTHSKKSQKNHGKKDW